MDAEDITGLTIQKDWKHKIKSSKWLSMETNQAEQLDVPLSQSINIEWKPRYWRQRCLYNL